MYPHYYFTKIATGDQYVIPTIKFLNSSSIKIQNHSLQHSTRQIVVIAEAAGDVTINHYEFVNNHLSNTAIYYLSNKGNHSDDIHELLINNCNFTYNLGGTSIMYVGTS